MKRAGLEPGKGYRAVEVEAAAEIAGRYRKHVVVILAVDREYGMIHTTSYGVGAEDKIEAATIADWVRRRLGDAKQSTMYEDFRGLDVAKLVADNERLSDLYQKERDAAERFLDEAAGLLPYDGGDLNFQTILRLIATLKQQIEGELDDAGESS